MRSALLGCIATAVALGVLAMTPAFAQQCCPPACQAGCGDAGCGGAGCGGALCDFCDPGDPGIIGGAEVTVLRPHFRENIAFVTNETVGNTTTSTGDFFDHRYDASPRIWLGYVGPHGFGGRVRWWFFDHASSTETFTAVAGGGNAVTELAFAGAPALTVGAGLGTAPFGGANHGNVGDTLTATSNVRAYTLDADLMQRLDAGHWKVNLGGGLRHASIAHDFGGVAAHVGGNPAGWAAWTDTLEVHSRFDGVGPTAFAELKRPFGATGMAFVSNVRGSYLYGDVGSRVRQGYWIGGAAPEPVPAFTVLDFSHQAAAISVGELQIGAEWSKDLGGANLFVQLLWEGQYWLGVGSGLDPRTDDMGLTGFTLQVGLTR